LLENLTVERKGYNKVGKFKPVKVGNFTPVLTLNHYFLLRDYILHSISLKYHVYSDIFCYIRYACHFLLLPTNRSFRSL